MTSPSAKSLERVRADYGFARIRDVAFDSIRALWNRRQKEGMKQIDVAKSIGRDAAWINRKLQAPGNWTFRTFAELAEGLNGEVEIFVHAMEDQVWPVPNYHAYAGYEQKTGSWDSNIGAVQPTAWGATQNTAVVLASSS